jgi:hypothetical protein
MTRGGLLIKPQAMLGTAARLDRCKVVYVVGAPPPSSSTAALGFIAHVTGLLCKGHSSKYAVISLSIIPPLSVHLLAPLGSQVFRPGGPGLFLPTPGCIPRMDSYCIRPTGWDYGQHGGRGGYLRGSGEALVRCDAVLAVCSPRYIAHNFMPVLAQRHQHYTRQQTV